jgi:hypothetical protein
MAVEKLHGLQCLGGLVSLPKCEENWKGKEEFDVMETGKAKWPYLVGVIGCSNRKS